MKAGGIKLLYLETPANPTIQCVDLEALCKLAKQYNIIIACDNTFATPIFTTTFSIRCGFHCSLYYKISKRTWYCHRWNSLGRDIELMKGHITKVHRLLGGNANPFDAFLLIQE